MDKRDGNERRMEEKEHNVEKKENNKNHTEKNGRENNKTNNRITLMTTTMTMIRGESGGKDGYYSTAFSKLCSAEHWCSVRCE